MTANARSTEPAHSSLPTLDDVASGKVTLDEYEIAHGEDIPELTDEDMARARPLSAFPDLAAALANGRRRLEEAKPVQTSAPVAVQFEATELRLSLEDGRELSVPLTWFPDLVAATPEQRAAFELTPTGVRWPALETEAKVADILGTQAKIAALSARTAAAE